MQITRNTTVADIATEAPATIRVFQDHQIDFCCGGKLPLAEACSEHRLDVDKLMAELEAALAPAEQPTDWYKASMTDLVRHIQATYHEPLRVELSRLDAMLAKVVDRHGKHLPDTLLPLQATFSDLRDEMLQHMMKEDRVLFPFIESLDSPEGAAMPAALRSHLFEMIASPISVMEAEHANAGAALETMRRLTNGYAPPEWACPTFRGLYYGLAQFESDMHVHVHLENNILFPRAIEKARAKRT